MRTLPDKPSELIRVALHDLEKCRRDPDNYKINMGYWHESKRISRRCVVCLAGAVMAHSLDAPVEDNVTPLAYPEPIQRKLLALDKFRYFSLMQGLKYMNIHLHDNEYGKIQNDMFLHYHGPYDPRNPMLFYNYMSKLADYFEKHGW